jgi:HK97 family phage prohead protease
MNSGRLTATLKSTSKSGSPYGSFEAVLSVPTKDRDGEVVDPGAFNPLPDHITIDLDHAMSVEKTVGSGRPFYDGTTLKFTGTYASHPLAQMVRSLVDEGHIRTMSVAYMNSVYETDQRDGLTHLRRAELLNAGIVAIPSNREALITASKSFNDRPGAAGGQSVQSVISRAQVSAARALVVLAEAELAETDRRYPPRKNAKQIIAEAEALLRRLKGIG